VQIAIPLYDGVDALDAVGPFGVLSRLPGAEIIFVAAERGPKHAARGLALAADRALSELSRPDVIVVPGGRGSRTSAGEEIVEWIRTAHASTRWTTSVCTGSLLLGAGGVLDGLRATSHWLHLDRLRELGAEPTSERVVREGRVITAAGVSSGIDMALRLAALEAGDDVAQAIQRDRVRPAAAVRRRIAAERAGARGRAREGRGSAPERLRRGSGAQAIAESRYAAANPPTVTSPTTPPPCSKASGIIVSASMVRMAPAAKACTAPTRAAEAESSSA